MDKTHFYFKCLNVCNFQSVTYLILCYAIIAFWYNRLIVMIMSVSKLKKKCMIFCQRRKERIKLLSNSTAMCHTEKLSRFFLQIVYFFDKKIPFFICENRSVNLVAMKKETIKYQLASFAPKNLFHYYVQ